MQNTMMPASRFRASPRTGFSTLFVPCRQRWCPGASDRETSSNSSKPTFNSNIQQTNHIFELGLVILTFNFFFPLVSPASGVGSFALVFPSSFASAFSPPVSVAGAFAVGGGPNAPNADAFGGFGANGSANNRLVSRVRIRSKMR